MSEHLRCEVCLRLLSPAEERAYYSGNGPARALDPALLAVTCAGCRERDRAVQARMHQVLTTHFRERGD